MDEVVIDGVIYVRSHYATKNTAVGDPSGFWDNFDKKEREEIRRRMIEYLVEAGYFMRKDDYEKEHSFYGKGELFYGL